MKKKILLIGGAGYIGSVITQFFLSKGYNVKCLDVLIYSQKHSLEPFLKNKNYEFIYGDLRSYNKIKNLFKEVTDIVILAGLVGDPITKKYPKESEKINYIALKNFIDNCNGKKLDKVIFVSTCSNYGLIDNNKVANESYNLNPLSNYAKQKVAMENYIMSLKGNVDYSITILRFATAFGISPRMRFDLIVNHFVKDAVLNGKLDIVFRASMKVESSYPHLMKMVISIISLPETMAENTRNIKTQKLLRISFLMSYILTGMKILF